MTSELERRFHADLVSGMERLALSIEAAVLLPWYRDVFTPDELGIAERRLQLYGFDLAGFLTEASIYPPAWWTEIAA